MSKEKKLLTVRQVADRLSVHPYTVYDLLRAGHIKGIKLRTHWRIEETELRRILADKVVKEAKGEHARGR